jgi:hypothetical protein
VRGIAGGADGNTQRGRKVVGVDARDEAVDDACGAVEVGIQQHQGERALLGPANRIRFAHLAADHLRHFLDHPFVGGHLEAVPLAPCFEHDQGEETLRAHGPLQLAGQHDVKRRRRQQPRAFLEERIVRHERIRAH